MNLFKKYEPTYNILYVSMKVVQILKDGSMKENEYKTLAPKSCCKIFQGNSKSQGNNDLKELYQWNYENSIIHCYGWYDGEAGFENKHEMVPGGKSHFLDADSSVQLLFGDIFLTKTQNKKCKTFDVSDYSEFYNIMFHGFDDCEDEEGEGVNTESEDEDFEPVSENEDEEEYEDVKIEGDELGEDSNEY
jgi:hypothetical protein|tara:strand:- start:376 stop:945 length:570 start_codon:yes stop_codon:yes gene_type:complete